MSRIPSLTSKKLIAALKKAGYSESRQSGSHLTLKHPTRPTVIVPVHSRELNRGLLIRIVKQAQFSTDEFLSLL